MSGPRDKGIGRPPSPFTTSQCFAAGLYGEKALELFLGFGPMTKLSYSAPSK